MVHDAMRKTRVQFQRRPRLNKPMLLYDSECAFCRSWVAYWRTITGQKVKYASCQKYHFQFPQISSDDCKESVWLVTPQGKIYGAAEAVFRTLDLADHHKWFWLYQNVPGFAPFSGAVYQWGSHHRKFLWQLTRFFMGKPVNVKRMKLLMIYFGISVLLIAGIFIGLARR